MGYKFVGLFEAALVEQKINALAGAELAGRAFTRSALGASALLRKLVADGKLGELDLVRQRLRYGSGGIFRSGHKQRF
jgi:hypothetical protein